MVGLCQAARLPVPVPEYRFDMIRMYRFDYAWPKYRLAMEVDGGIWTQGRHTRGAGKLADMEKLSLAAIGGWRILYVSPEQIRNGHALLLLAKAIEHLG